jgi:ADP-ribose pyrophosphatase
MKLLHKTKYLSLYENQGWTFASRKNLWQQLNGNKSSDAVVMCAKHARGIVVISQYRPCIREIVYDFPGGLIDSGESRRQAAIREMKEETGLDIIEIHDIIEGFASPGLTDENQAIVFCSVEGEPSAAGNVGDEVITTEFWRAQDFERAVQGGFALDIKLAMLYTTLKIRGDFV